MPSSEKDLHAMVIMIVRLEMMGRLEKMNVVAEMMYNVIEKQRVLESFTVLIQMSV